MKLEDMELIQKLCKYHADIDDMSDRLKDTMGDCVESPVMSLIFDLFNYCQELTEELVGDKELEWINWFIYDNDCGIREFSVLLSGWTVGMPVKTVEDLVYIIDECKKGE